MKKIIIGLLLGGLLGITTAAQAQSEPTTITPIESTERVVSDDSTPAALYLRAVDWAQGHFKHLPMSNFNSNASAREVRMTGTSKVTPVTAAGQEQPMVLYFDFVFRTTTQGYDYSVNNFRIVTTSGKAVQTTPLEDFVTKLGADRNEPKTHNSRRVTAQANSVASDVAMSFRSFMNSAPTTAEGTIGLPAVDH